MRVVVTAMVDGSSHLRNAGSPQAWCGTAISGGVDFTWEPGMDWGEHPKDCLDCVRALVRLRDLPVRGSA